MMEGRVASKLGYPSDADLCFEVHNTRICHIFYRRRGSRASSDLTFQLACLTFFFDLVRRKTKTYIVAESSPVTVLAMPV